MTEAKVPEDRLTPEEMEELYVEAEARHERYGDMDTLHALCAINTWRHEREVNRELRDALSDCQGAKAAEECMRLMLTERVKEQGVEIARLRAALGKLIGIVVDGMETTVPVTQADWIEALIDEACAPLTEAGLIPTRVMVPVRHWWLVKQSARRDGMRFAVGNGYVELVVASGMPEEPVVVAYAD